MILSFTTVYQYSARSFDVSASYGFYGVKTYGTDYLKDTKNLVAKQGVDCYKPSAFVIVVSNQRMTCFLMNILESFELF